EGTDLTARQSAGRIELKEGSFATGQAAAREEPDAEIGKQVVARPADHLLIVRPPCCAKTVAEAVGEEHETEAKQHETPFWSDIPPQPGTECEERQRDDEQSS